MTDHYEDLRRLRGYRRLCVIVHKDDYEMIKNHAQERTKLRKDADKVLAAARSPERQAEIDRLVREMAAKGAIGSMIVAPDDATNEEAQNTE